MIIEHLAAPLALTAALVLASAAVVHMYWALGGRIGVGLAIPETARGPLFRPSPVATLLVSLALVLAADLMLARFGLARARIPDWGMHLACGALALAFLARAVGDFRYVGFFKRVRESRFARLDTAVYSPLCLFLAVAVGVNV